MSGITVRPANHADRAALDAFIVARPEADMLQLWAWGESMADTGQRPERLLAERDGRVVGAMTMLVRPTLMGRTVVYAPHGPVWDREAADADALLRSLLDAGRDRARRLKAIVVKVDPRARILGDRTDGTTVAGAFKPLHMLGGYGHLDFRPIHGQPSHTPRAQKVEIEKVVG